MPRPLSHALRVLLVEDDPTHVALVQAAFAAARRGRFELETSGDLASSLRRLEGGGIDVVLLDLELPDSHGEDTLARVLEADPRVPVLVMTGLESEALGLRAIAMGAQDYLFKGHLNHLLLPRALLHAVERRRLQDELRAARVARPLVQEVIRDLLGRSGMRPPDLIETGRRLAEKAEADDVAAHTDAFVRMGLGGSLRWSREGPRHEFTATDLLERQEEAGTTTCYLTLGFLVGAVSKAHGGANAPGTEVKCQSRGDEACVFVVRVKDEPKAQA